MNKEKDSIRLPEVSDVGLATLRGKVISSLQLEAGQNFKREASREVANEIVQGIWFSSLELEIPFPDFGLIHRWNQAPYIDTKGRIILARVSHFPGGQSIVSFSPAYLSDSLKHFSSERILPVDYPLPREVAIHEMRHIWQHRFYRNFLNRDMDIYARYGLDGWETTESEKDAISYAKGIEGKIKKLK